ncbi:MFS transporter [Rugosibacter aromaticivorans]|uniref:MFS transporter n=1 Tax=Rugosibacter aromaticivorans TaxID=1565605 RepID=UPI001208D5FF|nr:MFS transporter [Rugosibacter aromaticivorans]TBR15455.1 MAG: MFS transporter [Rugosibacter sp.]
MSDSSRPPSPLNLLRQRRFLPLFITQFLGALNDNVIKNAMIVLLTFQAARWTVLSPGVLANLAAGIFILPFFLFSASAGQLADKYDKAWLTRWVKLFELIIVLIAGAGFLMQQLPVLLLALFLLGLHSTVFGPIKYAILPQHLDAAELMGGNALIETGTFIAILSGTLLGGFLASMAAFTVWIPAVGGVIALGGYFAARAIPVAVPPAPTLRVSRHPFAETLRNLAYARQNRPAFGALLGISWFWLYGAIFLVQIPAYAKDILRGNETSVTLLLAAFIVGIGAGAFLCEWLTRQRRTRTRLLVLAGGLGLSLFALDLYFASQAIGLGVPPLATGALLSATALLHQPTIFRVLADLAGLGVCGGLFTVPLYTLLQQASAPAYRARMIAANNIINALFMVVGALGAAAMLATGVSIPALFALIALANVAAVSGLYWALPKM